MKRRRSITLMLTIAFAFAGRPLCPGAEKRTVAPRKVLVELFTSQGLSSCPAASDLLGRLGSLGYGTDHAVVLSFHVDSFNTPWVDPLSDPSFGERQHDYNDVLRRDDLSVTPSMLVDGRFPVLVSNRPQVVAALDRANAEAAGVVLEPALSGEGARKTLGLTLTALSAATAGRDLVVGVALTEDPVTTKVKSGVNAGRTLVEHNVVRRFESRTVRLDAKGSLPLEFPLELAKGWDAKHVRVAFFVQDRATGKVHQADALAWEAAPAADHHHERLETLAKRKARRRLGNARWNESLSRMDALLSSGAGFSGPGFVLECPDCGSWTPPRSVLQLPPGINLSGGTRISVAPGPVC